MSKSSGRSAIRLRGVRHNNLKNFDLDLPLNQLIVITGLSGSGKSSLAFDTLFAEGQRRYIETFSPYARQFFDRMDKPRVDSIEGIPPAIAIEQRNAVKTTRSTVGTMTEICDYMKMVWQHIARLHCRQCGNIVRKDSPQTIWDDMVRRGREKGASSDDSKSEPSLSTNDIEYLITFDLPLTEKLSIEESLELVAKQGYQRLLVNGCVVRVDEAIAGIKNLLLPCITIIQDRVRISTSNRARFIEACEQAYHFGKGKLAIHVASISAGGSPGFQVLPQRFSNRLHCAACDIEYRDPSPALFSFNHPIGACPTCRGFGRVINIDYNLAVPDRSKTLAQGVVKPWLTGQGADCQTDLMRACRKLQIPTDVPFSKLSKKWQDFVIQGEPDYGKNEDRRWPLAWYGVKGYFRWLESKAYKMHVRVLLSRYRAYTQCPHCLGKRFKPDSLLYRAAAGSVSKVSNSKLPLDTQQAILSGQTLTLSDFYQMPIRDAFAVIESLSAKYRKQKNDPFELVLNEVCSRLGYLNEVGLGYLTLDRPTRTLSGGETERVNLTTCLGSRLVNTLFVLDEPSVGLHPRDTQRLVRILERLRNAGNTVVVVEHEAGVMRAADQIIDIGPGHGATGGEIIFQGAYDEVLKCPRSLTGQYLGGQKQIEIPPRRASAKPNSLDHSFASKSRYADAFVLNEAASTSLQKLGFPDPGWLRITGATQNNLRNLSVEVPLERFVCLTGVSGSGKTTLVREVLLPALTTRLHSARQSLEASQSVPSEQTDEDSETNDRTRSPLTAQIEGWERLQRVVLVDQSILGKTPRSNPAVYIGAFDDIREFFSHSEIAKQRGLNASAFSFNSAQGQCERCRGAGFEKIEMQFLSDVFIRCPDCDGRRYRAHILEIKVAPPGVGSEKPCKSKARSIADLLDSTVEEAIHFLASFPDSRNARRAVESLGLLAELGLGYLKVGQPINTLSGGECQRLKLVRHLAESMLGETNRDPHLKAFPSAPLSRNPLESMRSAKSPSQVYSTLFLFDEPTTGLHFDDVRVLLKVFQRLVDAGHSVLVIEHNLDVIKSADWVIDLGPDAGDEGGELVAAGTPEHIASCRQSHTGQSLQDVFKPLKHTRKRHFRDSSTSRYPHVRR